MALLSRQDYDRVIEALEFYLESHKEAPDFDSLGYNNLVNWLKICSPREISSAVERLPYKQDVTGSIPVSPTVRKS